MSLERHQGGWVIVFSFILALLLAIIPLPDWIILWRPEWVAMTVIYWCIALPERAGVFTGWLAGIAMDILYSTLLGHYALSYALLAYISLKIHRRLRVFPLPQQVFIIFLLIAFIQLPGLWVRGIQGHPSTLFELLYPAVTSMLLWPWAFISLRMLRQHFHVR
ncbi:rod shape-determining protein MreD [Candidatus Venteria ishoeyi]|uniref:Rod shape-determining protein MreD n=1 Tax=Candidatus Venteria ishoeyi TaxID=1899563 RepID=A0A1H6FF50_9GAMM|nr:rod shape-determining protein MreD [Candidatus Venteria ishoeyi]MDM8546894.1 rod shape-determining protein MreD [Candidatus Venteria ishoeyi]SEH08708.1 Rod shape-determining protein MreD [Candidatus Venteria ishoeyi]